MANIKITELESQSLLIKVDEETIKGGRIDSGVDSGGGTGKTCKNYFIKQYPSGSISSVRHCWIIRTIGPI